MPKIKEILAQLNIPAQCKKYGIPLWQCPHFLFALMGGVIIVSIIVAYIIGTRYIEDPELVVLLVLVAAGILFCIANLITNSFERLAEVSRMKTEFISVVSHQLRSPISSLKWATEFLMSGRLGKVEEKQLEYFKILKENNARMVELVNDLIMVSRIETASLPLKKKEISLESLIKELILEFEPFAKASNVEIEFQIEPGLPRVLADPKQIKLVIENLIDNAIRYIKGSGKIQIRLSKRGNNLYFEIEDNGVGIPKQDQKYIFQKFFRAANVLRYQTTGSGLGLYITKSIVENSGGKIGFKSEEGKGSTFWFTLPIKS